MLKVNIYTEQSRTALWSATLAMPCFPVTIRGYLTCAAAQSAARLVALQVFGRVPYFMDC